jgi:DNA mismatch repair protein MutS2
MDEKSLEILEFPQIKAILAGYTAYSLGRELAMELTPVTEYPEVSRRLQLSAEARELLTHEPGFTTEGAYDIRETVGLAALGKVLEPVQLVEVQQTLAVLRRVRRSLSDAKETLPMSWTVAADIDDCWPVAREIERCISPGGEVLDRASTTLAAVRRQLREKRQHLMERLEGIMKTPRGRKLIQEPIITERGGRYVIPVKIEYRKEIRGITHDLSNTGASVYVEPWTTVELGNDLRELVTAERREMEKILCGLSQMVGERESDVRRGMSRLAEIDLNVAKARYARAVRAIEPVLVAGAAKPEMVENSLYIKLAEARHPLLGGKAVPLSVEIGSDFSILVITGPNTGGKTVAMKTIGLLSVMTQAGIPIPASPETCLPVFDGVFADIGDEQSIEQTLSSFSWHMGNIVRIIRRATTRSLVLLDELGTSTDPAEGSALARVRRIRPRSGCACSHSRARCAMYGPEANLSTQPRLPHRQTGPLGSTTT